MLVETALSLVTVICDLNHLHHRAAKYIQARLAAMGAMFNVLLALFHTLHPEAGLWQISIAECSLINEHHWLLLSIAIFTLFIEGTSNDVVRKRPKALG